jgi:hypothetical protein
MISLPVFRRAPVEPDRHEEGIMVKTRIASAALAAMLVATLAWSASNLNLSKSNVYRLTYPTDLLSATQAKAMLAELDKLGPADEARLKQWLPANFRRGIARPREEGRRAAALPRDEGDRHRAADARRGRGRGRHDHGQGQQVEQR